MFSYWRRNKRRQDANWMEIIRQIVIWNIDALSSLAYWLGSRLIVVNLQLLVKFIGFA